MTNTNYQKLSLGLKSNDEKLVIKTLTQIRENGTKDLIKDLVDLFIQTNNSTIKDKIAKLLGDLRDQDSVQPLIQVLQSNALEKAHKITLSACWLSRLDFTDYLEVFIDVVLTQNFELGFEAFTVMENVEVKISEKRKKELLSFTKNKLKAYNNPENALAKELVSIIEQYEIL